jgi:hypothetical protein
MIEVHTQNRLSILAACEDPFNVSTYSFEGKTWPLPQTGQMWLEHELLNSDLGDKHPGFFCLSTSYRNEANPIEGRHCKIFPMFEFELPGGMQKLKNFEVELLLSLGYDDMIGVQYETVCKTEGISIIENDTEAKLCQEKPVVFLSLFPERTNPFWNMQRNNGLATKIDVLMHGQETIGSAVRSCDVEAMRTAFFTIEDGRYAERMFDLFGYHRVITELNEFFKNKFFERFGGGIGITRLIRSMDLKHSE